MDKRVKQQVLEYLNDLSSEEQASIHALGMLASLGQEQEEMLFEPLIAALQLVIIEAKQIIAMLEEP